MLAAGLPPPHLEAAVAGGAAADAAGLGRRGESVLTAVQLGMEWFPENGDGGLNRVFYDLTRSLPAAGVRCHGFVVGSGRVAEQTAGQTVAFASPTAPLLVRWYRARAAVAKLLRREKIDLAASHFALYTAPCLGRLSDVGLVVHFHGPWADESKVEGQGALTNRFRAAVERRVYRRADRYIVLSTAFRDLLRRSYGVPEDRIRIVPGGVDFERFNLPIGRAGARRELGWPTDRPVVLCVRRLVRRMGLENLVAAAARLRRDVPDVLVVIAGKGPILPALQRQVADLGLADHVRLLGFVPERQLPLAYRAADLSVVPTVALEGFGLIAVESLAAGTPVLVTPVGGLPEVVRDLRPELVVPGTGADDLADALRAALRGGLPVPTEAECRRYAGGRFDWGRIAAQVRAVYEEVVR